ncbi:MAG: cytochrome b/b6 domain-containing protein [Coriobacteriia bacterium]
MQESLWFDSATWLVWIAPFAGVLAAGLSKRKDPAIEGDRVFRHDMPARITHWTHGIGTMMLLVSGIALGLFFTPALVSGGESVWTWMNVHFAFVVMFLFGTFYYGANTLMATHRFREHLPTRNAIDYTKRHYGLLLGFKKFTFPPEAKYFESEKMAYLMALAGTSLIIITGLVKVAAHAIDMPAWVLGIATPVHDISTVVMLAFFLAHVFFAAIIPVSWPVLGSMFTGYVSLEHAKHEHAGWLAEIEGREVTDHAAR